MNNIISIDPGNITSEVITAKTSLVVESRLEKATDLKLMSNAESFEMLDTNEVFIVNRGEFENNTFKYEKDNFINLLHYCIAKTMSSGNVKLATGIPAFQYNQFKDEMKNKIMMNNKISVKIDNEVKNITIEECIILPECYGVFKMTDSNLLNKGAKSVVIDIGGGSTDLAYFDEGGNFTDGDSISLGLLDLYRDVQREVQNKFKVQYSIEDIKRFYDNEFTPVGVTGEVKLSPTIDNFKSLMNQILGKRKDLAQCNVIIAGGGARVYSNFFKKIIPHAIINTDIFANSKAYYAGGAQKWQQKKN